MKSRKIQSKQQIEGELRHDDQLLFLLEKYVVHTSEHHLRVFQHEKQQQKKRHTEETTSMRDLMKLVFHF